MTHSGILLLALILGGRRKSFACEAWLATTSSVLLEVTIKQVLVRIIGAAPWSPLAARV